MLKSTFKLTFSLLGSLLESFQPFVAQVDNYKKNKKISEKAKAAYNKDLKNKVNKLYPISEKNLIYKF